MFFHKKQVPAPKPTIPPETIERYVTFTKSPTRTKDERLQDLKLLIELPNVTTLAFYNGTLPDEYIMSNEIDPVNIDWLLIGTKLVTIRHVHYLYFIGEFLVYISRLNSDGNISPSLYIENVTPPNSAYGGPRQRSAEGNDAEYYGHPHINGNPSSFCMKEGSAEINYAIAEGNIPAAFDLIDEALHSFGPHQPFCHINFWPAVPLIQRR